MKLVLSIKEINEINKEKEKNNVNKRYLIRISAIELKSQGLKTEEIAEKLKMSEASVKRWIKNYRENGLPSLFNNGRPMNERTLKKLEARKAFEEISSSLKDIEDCNYLYLMGEIKICRMPLTDRRLALVIGKMELILFYIIEVEIDDEDGRIVDCKILSSLLTVKCNYLYHKHIRKYNSNEFVKFIGSKREEIIKKGGYVLANETEKVSSIKEKESKLRREYEREKANKGDDEEKQFLKPIVLPSDFVSEENQILHLHDNFRKKITDWGKKNKRLNKDFFTEEELIDFINPKIEMIIRKVYKKFSEEN